MYTNVVILTGITWNGNDNQVHLTDSTIGKVYAFAHDVHTGDIDSQRTFYQDDGAGYPDDHTIDREGTLWQALYGGSKVIKSDRKGMVTGEIHLPTRHVTCCTFVSTEPYIRIAKESEPDKYPMSVQFASNVFRVNLGVFGADKYKARM